ncbi:NDP-hexose 2,3-dehydratase family protein [Amycolatopsis taiwanensis]|uniref:NDP-hexose 2,3-dehydratase family protein n=1 Tax=Amycolatopsis taiwanensis TaxID=342230 RepID=UPI0004B8D514|nr:NDP-hexose 2,3-dehydratase family protein [Amycolatopsis taiwanensis]
MSHSGTGDVRTLSGHPSNGNEDEFVGGQVARSALARGEGMTSQPEFDDWLDACRADQTIRVERRALDELEAWSVDPDTGTIGHASGRFFTVEGVEVDNHHGPIQHWEQPIINQPEVGIQGLLVKEFDGVLHCLMQAKVEPGNFGGVQLSPTVQATRSNYTGVHGGRAVPYVSYFQAGARRRVVCDVRQSEQGAWCYRKHNRYQIVHVTEPVEVLDGFCWLTVRQLHELLAVPDLMNWAARSVLACLPFSADAATALSGHETAETALARSVIRSLSAEGAAALPMAEVLSWITEVRCRNDVEARLIPLREASLWTMRDGAIEHESGCFFRVAGFEVWAGRREVAHWSQPMLEAPSLGLNGLLVKRINGVLHAYMHARVEAGFVDVVELAPTVQCTPDNYSWLSATARPPYMDLLLSVPEDRIRFDVIHSEEGGRFYHARNRYLVVEVGDDDPLPEHEDYRWMSLQQLGILIRHSHYVNVQARSLLACVRGMAGLG